MFWVYYFGFLSCFIDPYFLFLCQHHTFLMTVTLYYSLKSGRLISPAPFFFLKIALVIQGLLCFHIKCEIFYSNSVKNFIGILIEIALNLDYIWQCSNFHNIDSSNLGTWNIPPSVYVVLEFSHQCLIVFSISLFCLLR